ncbi:MAG: cell division site-positioning protein MapZ family protein [Enterococcus sp.]
MMNKCPHCGFQSLPNEEVCPECGLKVTDSLIQDEAKEPMKNDNINWSEFKDLPIGSVMNHFNEKNEEVNENSESTEITKTEQSAKLTESKPQAEAIHKEPVVETVAEQSQPLSDAEKKSALSTVGTNGILTAYIRRSKGQMADDEPTLEELLAQETTEQSEPAVVETSAQDETPDETQVVEELEETEQVEQEVAEPLEELPETLVEDDNPAEDQEPETVAEPVVSAAVAEFKEDTEERPTDETPIPPAKRSKLPYLIICSLILMGAVGGGVYHHQEQVAAQEAKVQSELDQIQQQLAEFFVDDEQQFVQPDATLSELEKLGEKLDNYQDEEAYSALNATYGAIKGKITTVNQINALFNEPVIMGDQLVTEALYQGDSPINLPKMTTDDAFANLVNQAIDQGNQQLTALTNAKEAVAKIYQEQKMVDQTTREQYKEALSLVDELPESDQKTDLKNNLKTVDETLQQQEEALKKAQDAVAKVYQDKKLVDKATREQYDEALSLVDELPESDQKTDLKNNLKTADEALKKEEKAEAAEKKAAEAKAKVAAQKTAKEKAQASAASEATDANQPVMATDKRDVADSDNSAWEWADGVYNDVIGTCIDRGYIVKGGYKLEKAQIKDGEGYYNLYATNTKSSLMDGIGESALPFYIVTINCKTGYFQGNGGN